MLPAHGILRVHLSVERTHENILFYLNTVNKDKMNPLTNVKNIQKLNERILEMGVEDSLAWHKQYKDNAYVFIGGLPYDLTEGDILCVFSQYGEIVNINLVREKNSGKSKGYCFLCYEDQRSTVLAVDNFNGIKLGGRTIRVDHCANYRRPKSDEKDEQGNRKEIVEAGCAPKTPSPSPSPSEDEDDVLELPKKRKKDKKPKKHKKIKEEKKSQKKKKVLPDDEGHEKTLQKATISDGNAHIKGQGDKTNSPASEKNGRQNNFNTYGYKQVDNMREDISYSAVSQRERDKRDNRPRSQTDSTSERERYRERFEERGASSEHDRANCNRYDDNRKERGTRESPPRKRTDQNHRKRGERDPEHEKRVERSDSWRQRTDRKEGERSRDRRGRSDYENRNDRRRP